jgi:uncharacterized membrane protein YgdD (TMEM256/DUF423 family)
LGAFGAHYLKKTLTERDTLGSWKTAVAYQLFHALAILCLNTQENKPKTKYKTTIQLWTIGVCLFSGSIYGLSLGGPRLLGPVTPIGGLCLITGWLALLEF